MAPDGFVAGDSHPDDTDLLLPLSRKQRLADPLARRPVLDSAGEMRVA